MNLNIFPRNICLGQSILLLLLLGLAGCGKSESFISDPRSTGNEANEGVFATSGVEIEMTPTPETLTYANLDYGFEFSYPETWQLTEKDHAVVLKKDPHRLDIRFRGTDEIFDPHSGRTGIPAGDLIYNDKILFLDQVTPAYMLIYEKKYKLVFYGGTGPIEVDDLMFNITLEDLDTVYENIDLSEEIMIEAKSIVESFQRVDKADDSTPGSDASATGLVAHLETSDRLTVGESVNLKFVLKNVSDTPLHVLQWYTPLEGIGGEIFTVTHDRQSIPYKGILASRTPPTTDAYVFLNPGESVSAVVDLSKSYDFSQVGEYRINFISPRISHIAKSEAELAKTMEELGPVEIPSNEVFLELVGSIRGEGYPRLRTLVEAEEMIETYLRGLGLDLGIEPILPVDELHNEQLWSALQAQVFKIRDGKFVNESFLIWGSIVIQLGTAQGGQGLTSLVVSDIDQNGQAELFYTYSFGSDVQQSRIGMFSTAYHEDFIVESDIGFYGHLGVYSEDGSQVGVRVIEVNQDHKILRYQDPFGYLFIEQDDGNAFLGLEMFKVPPQEILEKLFSLQNSPQN